MPAGKGLRWLVQQVLDLDYNTQIYGSQTVAALADAPQVSLQSARRSHVLFLLCDAKLCHRGVCQRC